MTGKDLKKSQAETVAERNYGETTVTFEEGAQRYREYEERYRKEKGRELPTDPEHPDCLNHLVCDSCGNVSRSWPTDMSEASTCWASEIFDDSWWFIDHKCVCPQCFDSVIQDDNHYVLRPRYGQIATVPERFRAIVESADSDPEDIPEELEAWRSTCFDSDTDASDDEEVCSESRT